MGLRLYAPGFVPAQDMGYLIMNVQLPDAASIERTRAVTLRAQEIARTVPGITHTLSVSGMSFLNNATSSIFGSMFVILDDFENRKSPGLSSDAILKKLNEVLAQEIPEGQVMAFPAAPIRGVGRTGGFTFVVELREGGDLPALQQLQAAIDDLIAKGMKMKSPSGRPVFLMLNSVFRANAPQLFADLNRQQCMTQLVPLPRRRQHTAGLPRIAVRQQLQPARPHLAGDRAGRRPLPQQRRTGQAADGPQHEGRHGAHRFDRHGPRHQRAADVHALQHAPPARFEEWLRA